MRLNAFHAGQGVVGILLGIYQTRTTTRFSQKSDSALNETRTGQIRSDPTGRSGSLGLQLLGAAQRNEKTSR